MTSSDQPAITRLERPAIAEQAHHTVEDPAGDPVCWLDKVCRTCGLLTDTDEPTCPRCDDATTN